MNSDDGRHILSADGAWPPERWAAVVVIGALGILILIRMGVRGLSFGGASISVG